MLARTLFSDQHLDRRRLRCICSGTYDCSPHLRRGRPVVSSPSDKQLTATGSSASLLADLSRPWCNPTIESALSSNQAQGTRGVQSPEDDEIPILVDPEVLRIPSSHCLVDLVHLRLLQLFLYHILFLMAGFPRQPGCPSVDQLWLEYVSANLIFFRSYRLIVKRVINLFYIPGSFIGAFLSDWIGPKYCLALGVFLQGRPGERLFIGWSVF